MTVLRHRRFAAIWGMSVVSNVGTMMQTVGATWLMASLTPSAEMVALIVAANSLPMPLLGLFAGALADLHDRRRLLIGAQAAMLLVSAALAVLTLLGWTGQWTLLAATFLIGCGVAMNQPAWHASVNDLVPRADVPDAVALNSVGFNIGRTAGPAIGGLVVTMAGSAACFVLNAISYLGLLAVLITWRRPPRAPEPSPRQSIGAAMGEGVRYVLASPIRRVVVRALLFGFAGSAIWALTPLIARDLLHSGADLYGFLLGSFGGGAIVGALVNRRLRRRWSLNQLVRGALALFAIVLVGVALSRSPVISLIATFVCGGCWVSVVSTLNMSVQMAAERWIVARALAVYQTTIYAGMALGSWSWGLVAQHWGLPAAFLGSATLLGAIVLTMRRDTLPEIERIEARRDTLPSMTPENSLDEAATLPAVA